MNHRGGASRRRVDGHRRRDCGRAWNICGRRDAASRRIHCSCRGSSERARKINWARITIDGVTVTVDVFPVLAPGAVMVTGEVGPIVKGNASITLSVTVAGAYTESPE